MIDGVFLCPVCSGDLHLCERTLTCNGGHRFDMSSSGYVNLLRPGKMRNRSSGDDKGMVTARTRFLSAGYYTPNRDAIVSFAKEFLPIGGFVLDAGCGEGYYTNEVARSLENVRVIGIDASKHACDAAAKGAKRAGVADKTAYTTASLSSAPLSSSSVDLIISFFSPCDYSEFARLLRDDGKVLIGSAGKKHLYELKEILYGRDNVRDNEPFSHAERALGSGLVHSFEKTLSYKTHIKGRDDIDALYSMTPYFWRTPKSGAEALAAIEELTVTVEVDFTILSL